MADPALVPTPRSPDLATFTLLSNGQSVPPELQLFTAVVTFAANRIPHARIVLRDGDVAAQTFPFSESDTFVPGTPIELKLGYHGVETTVFKGLVTRHSIVARQGRPSQLVIDARHPAFKLTLVRKSRQFTDQTDADIASTILGELNLAGTVSSTKVTHGQMVQFGVTDWDFVALRARANGLLVLPGLDTLALSAPDYSRAAALSLTFGTCLESFEGGLEARTQSVSVTTHAWDPAQQQAVEFTASNAAESSAGVPDAAALTEAAGSPAQADWHSAAAPTDEIQAWAEAQLARERSAKIRGHARCQGFAGIAPGDLVQLAGLGARFNGKAFVAGVRQEFSVGVWKTDLQLGIDASWLHWDPAGPATAAGLLPAPSGLHVGVVRQLEGDPASAQRILVHLPVVLPDGEGLWARLGTLEAGDQRGFVYRPEIGDEVVVGFFGNDPRHPVVLGALHSGAHAAHIPAADANNEKGYLSRSKLKVHFDDDKKVLTLSTDAGNQLILSEEDQGITLQDQNGNKLVLSPDGIEMESIKALSLKAATDWKAEGVNLQASASASAKVEGSSGVEVSSGGSLTLKGSLVQIN